MAINRYGKQVFWNGNVATNVAANGSATSDTVQIANGAIGLSITVKANNTGTPAAGDEVEVYIKYTAGDPDADPDAADEFATNSHAFPLGTLDTASDNPAVASFRLSPEFKAFQVYVVNKSGTNTITVSAEAYEQVAE